MTLTNLIEIIEDFKKGNLSKKITNIEEIFCGKIKTEIIPEYSKLNISPDVFLASIEIKKLTSQIDVLIHSLGILLLLEHILNENEKIIYLSLGAGNTGKPFDLETTLRVAEFKFINWQGGSESIRQNSLFKDFYNLVESNTKKKRVLYLTNLEIPLKFFNSRRSIKSVLNRNNKLLIDFETKYNEKFKTVNEYYNYRKDKVELEDISKYLQKEI